jgi:PAS domain-containing protein
VSNIERLMLNTSPLPMAALAGSNHILRYVNAAFCRLAFKTGDELTGKPFIEVVPWEGCLALPRHPILRSDASATICLVAHRRNDRVSPAPFGVSNDSRSRPAQRGAFSSCVNQLGILQNPAPLRCTPH